MNIAMDFVIKILIISLTYSDIFKRVEAHTRREIGAQCWGISDCDCGEQCVDLHDLKPCQNGFIRDCACLKGCTVGNIFILAGFTRRDTYCNWCRCPLETGDGIPRCTRRPWCDPPDNDPEYIINPNCQLPSRHEKHEEERAYVRSRKSWRYPPFQTFRPVVTDKKQK